MKETFTEKVLRIVSNIPKGSVLTYKQVARLAGNERASRAVGTIMRKNKYPDRIPCYRVVRSDGTPGFYSAPGGTERKIAKLRKDGIRIGDWKT